MIFLTQKRRKMGIPILSAIGNILNPIRGIIDDVTTSEEEKLSMKAALMTIEAELSGKMLDYESALASEQAKNIRAEAGSQSWIARNWRPITMLVFVYIIAHNYIIAPIFGLVALEIVPDMWSLLKIGLGGYVVGRSAEKIVPAAFGAARQREET